MAQQVQRIGGQLLSANLQRELADLAFDTDLLVKGKEMQLIEHLNGQSKQFLKATIEKN